ncbi:phosphate acyltransferase [Oxobacter pfennigii]|uniref:Phosphate acyltransferase n=1 Tax=Oxobacter pfennigii TaxID=36849 RepID=A0A0P8W880_9CLOT|nr:phosphate acyltransferase PlsX [Oxobacter pfennigii]KPU43949.1 phosphate acyltransferase [Oxobacter pfennigii]
MKVVIDGMGGDNAPSAVVEGSVLAVSEYDIHIIIVGDSKLIEQELNKHTYDKSKIEVIHTSEVISTNEAPVMAIRRKKDSSMAVGMKLVKEGKAEAFISAGSTGALLAGALFIIGRIKGIDRPALAPILPGKNGGYMVVDVGANTDCKPKHLLQFAKMGSIYFKQVLKAENPKVGLVNIGTEEEKGNELTKETFGLLKDSGLNFVGNVEPREIPAGDIQVLVCDGFVGNTILKMFEGTAYLLLDALKEEFMSTAISKVGALLLKSSFKRFKKKFDYTEYGGAAFLGVEGAVIKAHGSSNAYAIKNAVRQAKLFIENDTLGKISESIKDTQNESED